MRFPCLWAVLVAAGVLGPRTVVAENGAKQRVAVVRVDFSGNVPEPVRDVLTQKLVEGLTAVEFDVLGGASVSDKRVEGGRASDCRSESCYPQVAGALGVGYLVTATVQEKSKTYEITLELVNGRSGGVVGTNRERCEICGLEEIGEKMSLAAATLKQRLEALTRAPARFVIRTSPSGALVTVGGKLVGRTPVDTSLPAGQHSLVISLDGYSPLERTLTVVSGVDESMHLDLVRLPTTFPYREAGWAAVAGGVAMIAAGGYLLLLDGKEISCPKEKVDAEGDCPQVWNTSLGGAALAGVGLASITLGGVWIYMASPGTAMGPQRAHSPRFLLGTTGRF